MPKTAVAQEPEPSRSPALAALAASFKTFSTSTVDNALITNLPNVIREIPELKKPTQARRFVTSLCETFSRIWSPYEACVVPVTTLTRTAIKAQSPSIYMAAINVSLQEARFQLSYNADYGKAMKYLNAAFPFKLAENSPLISKALDRKISDAVQIACHILREGQSLENSKTQKQAQNFILTHASPNSSSRREVVEDMLSSADKLIKKGGARSIATAQQSLETILINSASDSQHYEQAARRSLGILDLNKCDEKSITMALDIVENSASLREETLRASLKALEVAPPGKDALAKQAYRALRLSLKHNSDLQIKCLDVWWGSVRALRLGSNYLSQDFVADINNLHVHRAPYKMAAILWSDTLRIFNEDALAEMQFVQKTLEILPNERKNEGDHFYMAVMEAHRALGLEPGPQPMTLEQFLHS